MQLADVIKPKTDIVKTYVDWAAKQGFAVIDVNLPRHVADYNVDRHEHEEVNSVEHRTKEATQLLTYLWDNYVELSDSTHVFLMGTNIGHGAILNFIKSHEDRAQQMITKAISFVEDVALMSCKSSTNDYLPTWYYDHSSVIVSSEHSYWNSEYVRKPKRRFGNLTQSEKVSISDMLVEQQDRIFQTLLVETQDWKASKAQSDDDEMDVSDGTAAARLPPVGNFALSPAPASRAAPMAAGSISSFGQSLQP